MVVRFNCYMLILTASLVLTTATSFVINSFDHRILRPLKPVGSRQRKHCRIQQTKLRLQKEGERANAPERLAEGNSASFGSDKSEQKVIVDTNDDSDDLLSFAFDRKDVTNQEDGMKEQGEEERGGALRKLLESFGQVGNLKAGIPVGSTVVAGLSIPSLGIHEWQSYELLSIYDQGVDDITGMAVKIQRQDLNEDKPAQYGYQRYVTLYSKRYHEEGKPVVVSPEEISLKSLRDEVIESLLQALPLLGFWSALAFSFANLYNEKYGGNFFDALFRT